MTTLLYNESISRDIYYTYLEWIQWSPWAERAVGTGCV
jgi:hypothetical protein